MQQSKASAPCSKKRINDVVDLYCTISYCMFLYLLDTWEVCIVCTTNTQEIGQSGGRPKRQWAAHHQASTRTINRTPHTAGD